MKQSLSKSFDVEQGRLIVIWDVLKQTDYKGNNVNSALINSNMGCIETKFFWQAREYDSD